MLNKFDLFAGLRSKATALGLTLAKDRKDELTGTIESVRAKWFLGGRKATYQMSFRLSEAERVVYFREAVTEKTWGIPPPTFVLEKETITGWKRSGKRDETSVGGGGAIDYSRVRGGLEQVATAAGWQFHLEGRMP